MCANTIANIKNLYVGTISVLHIEDDSKVAKKLATELIRRNIYVHSVSNLSDAIKILKKCEVNFVVCDGRFPSFSGGEGGIANFIPLSNAIKKMKRNSEIIGWANSTTVHEYCHKNKLESYSKLQLRKENFARRNREFIKIRKLSAKELANILEQKIAENIGFCKTVKKLKLEHYYNEPGNVLGMFMSADMRTKFFKETAEKNYGPMVSKLNDGMLTVLMDKSNDALIAESVYKKIIQRDFFPEIEKNVNLRSRVLLNFVRQFKRYNFKNCSNRKLKDLYIKFCSLFIYMRMYSSLPTAMEHESNMWSNLLKKILVKKIAKEEEINRVFSLLTTPDKPSYLNNFDFELAKIGLKKFSKKDVSKEINKILDRFAWINYHFEGIPLKRKDIIDKIGELGQSQSDFRLFILDNKNRFLKIQKLKNEIYRKYSFSKREIEFFNIGSAIVYIKFYRKGIFAESYYSVEFLLKEIGRRIKCTLKQVQNMTADEVLAALEVGFYPGKLSDQVEKRSIMFHNLGKTYILGPHAEKVLGNSLEEKSLSFTTELKGQTAFPGKVKGFVRIINIPTDMKKMKNNDILVSRSTNPSLFFAMKKSAAIVTDLGGLTCHAAIVARELKKPCVVGIKNATHFLSDGDIVEVNASKGMVKVITKKII